MHDACKKQTLQHGHLPFATFQIVFLNIFKLPFQYSKLYYFKKKTLVEQIELVNFKKMQHDKPTIKIFKINYAIL